MVSPPRPGVRYSAEQMTAMQQAYPDFVMPGYVMRIDADNTVSFVPWHKAAGGGAREDGTHGPQSLTSNIGYRSKVPIYEDFPVAPIKKRTPQQRTDSMMDNLVGEWKTSGTIPGLSEEKVSELVTRSWKRGQPLSAEDIRTAAASLLHEAENRYKASERKRIVRTAPSD